MDDQNAAPEQYPERYPFWGAEARKRRAFEAAYRAHEVRIYNFILRMVGNPDDAADIMQETFVNAWRSWGKFRGESQVFTWLYQIAYNNVKNWYKVRDRRRGRESFSLDAPVGTDDDESMARDVADWSALPDRLFLDKELDTLVRDAVDALTPEYRDVFVLSVWENMSYEEVAQVSGLTVPAVKTRLHRARLKIKLRLDPYIAGLGKEDK